MVDKIFGHPVTYSDINVSINLKRKIQPFSIFSIICEKPYSEMSKIGKVTMQF